MEQLDLKLLPVLTGLELVIVLIVKKSVVRRILCTLDLKKDKWIC